MLRQHVILVLLVVSLVGRETAAVTKPTFKPSNKTEPAYYDYDEFEVDQYPSDYYYYDISLNKEKKNDDDANLSDDNLMYKMGQQQSDSDLNDKEKVHEIKNAETIILDAKHFPIINETLHQKTTKVKDSKHQQQLQMTTIGKGERVVEKAVISEDTFLNMSYVLISFIGLTASLLVLILLVLRQKRTNKSQNCIKSKIVAQKEYISVEQVSRSPLFFF